MSVEIRLYGQLRDVAGLESVSLPVGHETTVRDVVETLATEYPELEDRLFDDEGSVDARVVIRKNRGPLENLDVGVADGDRIALVTQVVGGGGAPGRYLFTHRDSLGGTWR